MSRGDGGPAFPLQTIVSPGSDVADGMSLRDYFASMAMQGLCSSDAFSGYEALAKAAYEIADAMIAARTWKK